MMFMVLLAFLQFNSAFADCGPSKQNSTRVYQCNGDVVMFKRSDVGNGTYSVSHIITYPSKELCSKMALGEMGVSLP